jgi:hypothetical protein
VPPWSPALRFALPYFALLCFSRCVGKARCGGSLRQAENRTSVSRARAFKALTSKKYCRVPMCSRLCKRQNNRSVGASSARCDGIESRGIDANMEGKAGPSKLGDCAPAFNAHSCHALFLSAVRGKGKRDVDGQHVSTVGGPLSCSPAPAFFRRCFHQPDIKPASKNSSSGKLRTQQLAISP